MTPEELIAKYYTLPARQDLAVFVQFLADHIYEARVPAGWAGERKLSDVIDCKIWLEELAIAANSRMLAKPPAKVPAEQPRWGRWER